MTGPMKTRRQPLSLTALLAIGMCCSVCAQAGQDPPAPKKEQAPAPAAFNRLTVEVTGGEANKSVENASVYVKTVQEHTILKDKKTELNVKTNQRGIAHIPEPPVGRVLIQIVVPGWKTFGKWYEITDPNQVIKIHLERPPKWY